MTTDAFVRVSRIPAPSPAVFEQRFLASSTPVVMTGLLDAWPALRTWSPEYLAARAGDARVPSATTHDGMLNHHPDVGITYEPVELARFSAELRLDPPPPRYVTFALEDHLPQLADDVRPFAFARDARWTRRRVWFGPAGSASPMHRDLPENLYAQIVGRKRMFLFPREATSRMYPHPWYSSLPNFARVDAENPDFQRFPRFAGAPGLSVVLEPGDVLFLPSLWWHQARTLDVSISFNLWWSSARPLSALLKVAEAYKRARNISI